MSATASKLILPKSPLDAAFPKADPDLKPFGNLVLVQIRSPKTRSDGGIILPEETRETELWNTQVAKIIAFGPNAFRNRDTGEIWPEGEWAKAGDFVRVPKYGGDRWWVLTEDGDKALFVLFKDTNLQGIVVDPLRVLAFI